MWFRLTFPVCHIYSIQAHTSEHAGTVVTVSSSDLKKMTVKEMEEYAGMDIITTLTSSSSSSGQGQSHASTEEHHKGLKASEMKPPPMPSTSGVKTSRSKTPQVSRSAYCMTFRSVKISNYLVITA